MRNLSIVEKEISGIHKRIATMQSSYNTESNKAHLVEKEMGKLTERLMDLMCERHLLIENWEEADIDEAFGEVMTIAEFGRRFAEGDLMDDDGMAFYVTEKNKETDIQVFPTWIISNNKRGEFNHIIWYYNDEIESMNDEFDGVGFDEIEEEF